MSSTTSSQDAGSQSLGAFGFAGDDAVVPFHVEALDARGRAVQLGTMLDQVLGRHDYPEPVSRLLAEMIVLTVLLGTSLKFEGKFIAQAQTDGPVDLLVVDFTTPSSVRAYARFDEARVAAASAGSTAAETLLGSGTMALTVDQGGHMQRYQGIVELTGGASLEDVAEGYFRQSEQIPTTVRLAVARIARRSDSGGFVETWRAGGLIAQFLPESPERMRMPDLPGGDAPEGTEDETAFEDDDAWTEVKALVETVHDSELADPDVGVERLLFRLFHERGVRVFPATPVIDDCSCSRERIKDVLSNFSAEEITDSIEEGRIAVTCEFCGEHYDFAPNEFLKD
ncbi:Hsp33-like chaperonin [Aureimonas sp. Leaf454]|uniref:Hsp33 family molecular chaperone n=1 Tax=Aureimonas sp. Leaf454 TaxID=1736381 RepID=UPI0006FE01CF|nr:Hsp33 family molecular chaperone [Aureimonas sp. Leaf454]KQT54413.1 Hsp33-like chaperonin [Aureimonas sp. Leaf454]